MEAIPSIEERLTSLERSMGEMTRLMREMIDRSPSTSYSSASQSTQSINLDEASSEGSTISHFLPKPAHLIQELQSEFFGEADAPNTQLPGDLVTKGIVDSRLSMKLMQLCVPLLNFEGRVTNCATRLEDSSSNLVPGFR